MERILTLCFAACCLFLCPAAFAEIDAEYNLDGKFYIEPGTVHVGPNGIFLNLEGNFIPVNAVCVDEGGVYVIGYKAVTMVYCPECENYYDADNQSSECRNSYHPWYCRRQA